MIILFSFRDFHSLKIVVRFQIKSEWESKHNEFKIRFKFTIQTNAHNRSR